MNNPSNAELFLYTHKRNWGIWALYIRFIIATLVWFVLKQIYEHVNVQEVKEALDSAVNMMDSVSSSISGMLPKVRN